jgi:hypothetical protein
VFINPSKNKKTDIIHDDAKNRENIYICTRVVSKKFGKCYQETNKTEDTNKLTLLAFKIIAILHHTLLATFIKLLETASKGL